MFGQELKQLENYLTFMPESSGLPLLLPDDRGSEMSYNQNRHNPEKFKDELQGLGTFIPQDLLGDSEDLDMQLFGTKKF